jgi:putative mRNA 3-end processing factor
MESMMQLYAEAGVDLGEIVKVSTTERHKIGGEIVLCPPSALGEIWSRRFSDPVTAFASGWMRTRARARQRGIELPLVVSDHADWQELCATIAETGCEELWVTHGQEDALLHWAGTRGLKARPLHMVGYGDDGEAEPA